MRKSDPFVVAAWAAAIFGLMEGIVLCVSLAYPAILAPYKVSAHILWIAPAVDLVLFLLAALAILILAKLTRKRLDTLKLLIVYGFFVFLGILAVITAPVIIHTVSAVLLSLGLTVVFCRKLRGSERQLTEHLRGRLVWVPVLIVSIGIGVIGYEKARERWLSGQLPAAPSEAMNVLVVVMDTVRHDKFDLPAERSLTPHLDRIVASGVRFDNAWATSSWSLPTQASILTGRYPREHGADWPHLKLDEKYPTLGEFFTARGYVTGAFSGNAAWTTPAYLGRGFLRFDVYKLEDLLRRTVFGRKIGKLLWHVGYHDAGRGKKAPEVNAQLLEFLNDYPQQPFFAYLCYMDVNQAFHHRRLNHPFWEKSPPVQEVIAAYDQGLSKLDAQIGDLFTKLEQRGILKNTVVVITSDHGESFGAEEGAHDNDPSGHGTSLYPEQTRVPLFVIYPSKLNPGQKIARSISTRAIPAMITHLLGSMDSPFGMESLPFDQEPKNTPEDHNAPLLTTLNYNDYRIQSVIWDHWQYINNLSNPRKSEELYNLTGDPLAKKNLAADSHIVAPIRGLLEQLLIAEEPQTPTLSFKNPERQAQADR